jgi:hypothetical protein
VNEQEARAAVEALVAAGDAAHGHDSVVGDPLVLPYGWVFGYQSRSFLETGDFRDAYCGNAPFLVEKDTGRVLCLGTAHPIEHYLSNYEATGDPHSRLGRTVRLEGGRREQRRHAIRALMRDATLPAAGAASMVDDSLCGHACCVVLPSERQAIEFVNLMTELGFSARRMPEAE